MTWERGLLSLDLLECVQELNMSYIYSKEINERIRSSNLEVRSIHLSYYPSDPSWSSAHLILCTCCTQESPLE